MTAVPQSQVSISRRALDIEDYIDIARRHVSWIVGPLYAGIVIATIVAFFLPNVYVSRAMLRITPPMIPESLVPATFNQQMSDRINQMWQEVLSRSNMSELIQRPSLQLYPSQIKRLPIDDVIEEMKNRDIHIDIVNQSGGKANTAFIISFSYPEKYKAQQVVSALVTKLTDANQISQRTGVNLTSEVITDEVKQAKLELDTVDQELLAYKTSNNGRLPEQLAQNVSQLNAIQSRFQAITDLLQRNDQSKVMLEQTLSTLKGQKSQMESMGSGTQEEMTKEATVKNEEIAQLKHEITLMEAELAVRRKNLTEKHPDVIDLKSRVDALKERRDQMIKDDAAATAAESSKPKAPAPKRPASLQYQQALQGIQAQIDQTSSALTGLEMDRLAKTKEQEKLNAQLAAFEARIDASPINEQKYISLMRARNLAAEHYETLQKKSQLAAQGIDINQRKAGEMLDVLDTASLPETPTAPNRWQIVGIGAALGLLAGIAMAGAKEMKDTSLKNLKDVRAYTNLPVLSSIPLLENALLVRRKRRLTYVAWAVAVIVGLMGTAISVYYHTQISSK